MSYLKSGVDTRAADCWVEGLSRLTGSQVIPEGKLVSGVGSYAAVFQPSHGPMMALSCDGIGSKIFWALEELGSPEALAQDLVAMNNNDLLCVGARPALFLDYLGVSGAQALQGDSFLKKFVSALVECCRRESQLLVGGETAQLPDLYQGKHFDVAGFSLGFLSQEDFLNPEKIQEGDEVWGLPSSGPHSNGFSWLRKLFCFKKDASFIQEHLMQPTRLYQKEVFLLKEQFKREGIDSQLRALFHITGSGILNLLRYSFPISFDLSNWPDQDPQWVCEIKKRAGATEKELFETFNMGFGMIFVIGRHGSVEKSHALLNSLGLRYLGVVDSRKESRVKVRGLELK